MASTKIRESYDGGSITVETDPATHNGRPHVLVCAHERAADVAVLTFTLDETDQVIAALQAARAQLAPMDENAEAVAAVLAEARTELLDNSTPVELETCDDDCRCPKADPDDIAKPDDAGHSATSAVLSVGGLGALLAAVAASAGHLPIPRTVNGLSALVITGLLVAVWRCLTRDTRSERFVDRLVDLDQFDRRFHPNVPRGTIRDWFISEEEWALLHYPEDVEQW